MGKLENLGAEAAPDQTGKQPQRVVISIGLSQSEARVLSENRPVIPLSAAELTGTELARHDIALVCCPIWHNGIDALDVTAALALAGYTGVLAIITPKLPNKAMVLRELRRAARGIEFRFISP